MVENKRLIIWRVLLLVLLVGVGLFFARLHLRPSSKPTKLVPSKTVDYVPPPDVQGFDAIKAKIASKKWTEAINLAAKYGEDTSYFIILRIDAYAYCVYAATQSNDKIQANTCMSKGNVLLATLPEADQDLNKKIFDAYTKGLTYVDKSDNRQQVEHE